MVSAGVHAPHTYSEQENARRRLLGQLPLSLRKPSAYFYIEGGWRLNAGLQCIAGGCWAPAMQRRQAYWKRV